MTTDKKASLGELKHAGVKGMRWRITKNPLPPPPSEPTPSIPTQATHVLRRNFGFAVTRTVLQRFGSKKLFPSTPKPVVKEADLPLKYTNRVTKGAAVTLRILGTNTKVFSKPKPAKSLVRYPSKVANKSTNKDVDKVANKPTKSSLVNRSGKVANKMAR